MHLSAKARIVEAARDRYSTVAILFHWLIAAGIVVQLALGWHMGDIEGLGHSLLLQLHKSVGISILVLTAGRLAWRVLNPPPPHGSNLTPLEAMASHWVHMGFYAALFLLPLTGWAMTSLERASTIMLFGVVPWPAFPLASALPSGLQDLLSDVFTHAHTYLVWVMLALLFLHVAGALKHHFISKDPTVSRMAPGVQPGVIVEPRLLAIPVVALGVAALIYLPKLPEAKPRPKVVSLAKADVYLDIIGPALNRRCAGCHSDDDSRGGFSVSSYASLMQGARHGPVITPGNPAKSELYHLVTLPADDKMYMPQDGKTPLTKSELTAISWWISQGAPKSALVGSMKLTPDARDALQALIGSDNGGDQPASTSEIPLPTVPVVDKALIDKVVGEGFIVRKVDANSNLVVVDYISPKPVTPDVIADLAKFGTQILNLNLRRAGLTDAELKTVAGFTNLRILRLEDNAVTDAGLKELTTLKSLNYINLSNTKVTEAGLEVIAQAPQLKRVYFWNSTVAPAAIDKLRAAHKGVFFDPGLTAKDVTVETKVMTPAN
jgi:cytochrome b561